jgi:hypothetical protein
MPPRVLAALPPQMVGGGNFLPQAEGEQPSFHLFAYPAMDNYAGVLYPLDWVQSIRQKSHTTHLWKARAPAPSPPSRARARCRRRVPAGGPHPARSCPGEQVLLDAAAFVGSHSLNLTQAQPDFVPVSFYKIFGWPTGLGALLVRTDNMPLLKPVGARALAPRTGLRERGWPVELTAPFDGMCAEVLGRRVGLPGDQRSGLEAPVPRQRCV